MKFLLFSLFFLILPLTAHAGILPPCTATGNCGVCDIMFTVSAILRWIVFVAGSLALLLFVWGGVLFVTSGGSSARVGQAKKILANTILGIVIVFVAWTFVNFIIDQIAGTPNVLKFSEERTEAWYNLCKGTGTSDCFGKGDGYPCNGRVSHCLNGKCQDGEISACDWLNDHAGYTKYKCQDPKTCGIKYNECETAPNCLRNLCPGGTELVCCYRE